MKSIRFLGFPIALVYGMITSVRNHAFDKGWFESREYDLPIICVGNLSMGGTGKSPMVAFLVKMLKNEYKVAVLSRGYKRRTSGFREVFTDSTALEVGDEPLQFKQNFPQITVAVCEDRRGGIEQIKSQADVILLDDAFQHRKVKPALNILLTSFDELFLDDYIVPMGSLREARSGADRADIIVVTKCPEHLAYAKQQEIQLRMGLKPNQRLYFSKIGYDSRIYGKSEVLPLEYLSDKQFTLLTGIANPGSLVQFLEQNRYNFTHVKFPDHHQFTLSEIKKLAENEIILTTEKDYMRLQPHMDKFALYYLPIKTILLNEQEEFFRERVLKTIKKYS